jgi:PAS domain S-box-containing protein
MADSQLIGIFTKQDLVKVTAEEKSIEGITVAQVMTRELVTLKIEEFKDIFTALDLLRQHRIRHLPILGEQGELLGIVTESNILQVLDPVETYRVIELLQRQISQLQTDRTELEQQVQQSITELRARSKREQLITSIALRIRESLDLDTALSTVVEDVRHVLKADRVLLYKFAPDMSGNVLAESVTNSWTAALSGQIQDICLLTSTENVYRHGQQQAIANIYEANLTDSHLQILEQLQVKAYLVVPIVISNTLWGLLIAHQCSAFRSWKRDELNLMDKIAIQLAVAIKQVELYNHARVELTERYKIEAQLRLERNFVSTVLNVADALVVVLDFHGKIVRFNHACEQTTGYTFDEVESKFIWDFLLIPEETEPVKAVFQNLKQRQLRNRHEHYWVSKGGDRRLISWSNNVLLNRDEQVEYIVCTGIDITESRKAEEELRQTRNFLQSMIDNLPVAVFVKDAKAESFGKFRLWNQACDRMFGLTAEQAIGKTDYDFFPKAQADFFHQKDQDAVSCGITQDIAEELIDSHSLGRRILHTTKVPLYDKHHQPEYLLCISEDITERKQAEQKLQQAKEQLQTVLDAVPGFVSWVSADGYYLGVNRHLAESFNLSTDAFVGQELGFMLNSPQFTEFMREFLATPDLADSSVIDAQIKETTRNYLVVAQKYQQNSAAVAVGIDITQRKQMEIALAESEAMLRSVLDSTPSFVTMVNREGKILFINQTVPDLSVQEVIGTNIDYYVVSDDLHIQRSALERVFNQGEVVSYETRSLSANGSFTYNHSQIGPIWRDGEIIAAVIVTNDISDRKLAEVALRESEQKFRLFTENIKSTFWIADIRGDSRQIVYVSPAYEEIWGRSTEEAYASSDTFLQAIHPADRHNFIAHTSKITQEEHSQEYRIIRQYGAIRWIRSRSFPIKNEKGKVYRITGIAEDITEVKQAEVALQKLNRELETRVEQRTLELQKSQEELKRQFAAVEAAIDGIAILSQDTYTYVNKAHVEMFGYASADELIGKSWQEIYNLQEINRLQTEVFPALVQQKHWRGEAIARRKDGSTFDEEVSLTISEQGDLICVCRDISQRKKAEEEIRNCLYILEIVKHLLKYMVNLNE